MGTTIDYQEGDLLVRRDARTRNGVYDIEWRIERLFDRNGVPWVELRRVDGNSRSEPKGSRRAQSRSSVDWMLLSQGGQYVVEGAPRTLGRAR